MHPKPQNLNSINKLQGKAGSCAVAALPAVRIRQMGNANVHQASSARIVVSFSCPFLAGTLAGSKTALPTTQMRPGQHVAGQSRVVCRGLLLPRQPRRRSHPAWHNMIASRREASSPSTLLSCCQGALKSRQCLCCRWLPTSCLCSLAFISLRWWPPLCQQAATTSSHCLLRNSLPCSF